MFTFLISYLKLTKINKHCFVQVVLLSLFQNLKKQIKLNQIQHLIETNIAIVINCFTKLKNIY